MEVPALAEYRRASPAPPVPASRSARVSGCSDCSSVPIQSGQSPAGPLQLSTSTAWLLIRQAAGSRMPDHMSNRMRTVHGGPAGTASHPTADAHAAVPTAVGGAMEGVRRIGSGSRPHPVSSHASSGSAHAHHSSRQHMKQRSSRCSTAEPAGAGSADSAQAVGASRCRAMSTTAVQRPPQPCQSSTACKPTPLRYRPLHLLALAVTQLHKGHAVLTPHTGCATCR